jgi:hypothetical protein
MAFTGLVKFMESISLAHRFNVIKLHASRSGEESSPTIWWPISRPNYQRAPNQNPAPTNIAQPNSSKTMFMGPPLMTSQIIYVTELFLKWISRIIPYKKKFRQPLQPSSECNKITRRSKTNLESDAHRHSHGIYRSSKIQGIHFIWISI